MNLLSFWVVLQAPFLGTTKTPPRLSSLNAPCLAPAEAWDCPPIGCQPAPIHFWWITGVGDMIISGTLQ